MRGSSLTSDRSMKAGYPQSLFMRTKSIRRERIEGLEQVTGASMTGGSMTERDYASNHSKLLEGRHNSYLQAKNQKRVTSEVDFTAKIDPYLDQIEQIFRQYTMNDQHTMGLGGFLKFLKDLNLIKPAAQQAFDDSDVFEDFQQPATANVNATPYRNQPVINSDGIFEIDVSRLSKIKLHKAELLFTQHAINSSSKPLNMNRKASIKHFSCPEIEKNEFGNKSKQRLTFDQFIACLRQLAPMIMEKQALSDQITLRGGTRSFYQDELFYMFIKQYLCVLDQDYRIEKVANGVFQTTLNLDRQQMLMDSRLHPFLDLLRSELVDYIKKFCSDSSQVLTFP